ncbi:MAG: hypothetical protein J7647_03185 [Cyanobacteria bacterium SBLK]|nr:hypothetical protein [Cyanobacteria bacterium SBLK]
MARKCQDPVKILKKLLFLHKVYSFRFGQAGRSLSDAEVMLVPQLESFLGLPEL